MPNHISRSARECFGQIHGPVDNLQIALLSAHQTNPQAICNAAMAFFPRAIYTFYPCLSTPENVLFR